MDEVRFLVLLFLGTHSQPSRNLASVRYVPTSHGWRINFMVDCLVLEVTHLLERLVSIRH